MMMRWFRFAMVLATTLAVALCHTGTAHSCSCDIPGPPEVAFDKADVVVEAEVRSNTVRPGTQRHRSSRQVVVQVDQVRKGRARDVLLFHASLDEKCGRFEPGKRFLLYLYRRQGVLTVPVCGRRSELTPDGQDDRLILNELQRGAELAEAERLHAEGRRLATIGEYQRAASILTDFTRRFPKDERAPDALSDALQIELALGHEERAKAALRLFRRMYGRRMLTETVALTLAYAQAQTRHGRSKRARRVLRMSMRSIDHAGTLAQRIAGHTLLAHAHAHLDEHAKAAKELRRVRAAVTQLKTRAQSATPAPTAGPTPTAPAPAAPELLLARRLLEGVYERRVVANHQQTLQEQPPKLTSAATPEKLQRYLDSALEPWLVERSARLQAALTEFRSAPGLGERVVSAHTVAFHAWLADRWQETLAAIEAPPSRWMQKARLAAYRQKLAPHKREATEQLQASLRTCIRAGSRSLTALTQVRRCEQALARMQTRRRIDELLPALQRPRGGFLAAPVREGDN